MSGGYDVIVIGAGSAGAVLASRLSEDPGRRVLLVEAGPVGRSPQGNSFFDALRVPGRAWQGLLARRTPDSEPVEYRRGRGAGGSSAVNAMVAIPGVADDYDRWVALGADGWGWSDLEPWFSRTALELNVPPEHERGPVERAVIAALPYQAGPVPLTRTADGSRRSTYECYLESARPRPNLKMRFDTAVERLLIEGRRVIGVRLSDGSELRAGEVIVSAGAIHSPALLLGSGIDTPGAGKGLKDHPAFAVAIELDDDVPWDPTALPIGVIARSSSGESPADLQILPVNHVGPESPRTAVVMVALMEVRSEGQVSIAADRSDAVSRPVIDFGMLTDPADERRLRIGIDQLLRMLDHPAIRALGHAVVPPTDADGLRANLGDYVHAACSCAIGRVLDPLCRVIGYDGVRVVDASVMPDLPRANTHLTTVVIAERVADLIRQGY